MKIATVSLLLTAGCALASPYVLLYDKPAAAGMNEALPIGGGQFGGLIYGAPARERIILNESSLWTGTEVSSDDYEKMGSYQMLGELFVEMSGTQSSVVAVCASGHKAFFENQEVAAAGDGDPGTKWCVEHHGRPVIWELSLPAARAIEKYSLTSADDVPERDPSTWVLSGSDDGREWTPLDRRTGESLFQTRGQTRTYAVKESKAFRRYRLTFQPNPGVPHFQVAEITVPGLANSAKTATAQNYRRALDLGTALHTLSYNEGEVVYRREAFASHADGVMALRLSADHPASCAGVVRLKGAHQEQTDAADHWLRFAGTLPNGLRYETKLIALHDGGTLRASGGTLEFQGCHTVTLLLAAGTDYVADYSRKYRGENPRAAIERRLSSASSKSYEALKAAHVADFQSLFNRAVLDLGTSPAARRALPMNRRKALHAAQGGDPDLEAALFQYGRYLMIACSRPGGLPANLQGLWCDSNNPPWHSDYHANINIQMNYWPAEPANLGECHTPLFELIASQLEPWRHATAAEKRFATPDGQSRGWAVRTSHGIHGDQGWQWDITANAWYCQHFWMHFAFDGDEAWLRNVAYPVMKETCEFWEQRLKKLPNGRLVIPNGWSPEHGPNEDGVSYCQQIVWDLFNNYVAASTMLQADADYRGRVAGLRDGLLAPQIGNWGQLMEWMVDRDDPKDHHRHTSHLFAVYPGQQLSPALTPALASAAAKSLAARGEDPSSDVREWSFAWRSALYARLHDGENAHRMVQMFLADRNTCPNLFGLHPPMQIDGNFGITAGICEMLLQSHAEAIELLPALPKAWSHGHVSGLRARGGYTVDIEWRDTKVTKYRIAASEARSVKVHVNGETRTITSEKL